VGEVGWGCKERHAKLAKPAVLCSVQIFYTSRYMTAQDIKQDFEGALVKHLLFKSKLRSYLYGSNIPEAPIRDPEVCALGQWIRERRTGAYAHLKQEMRHLDTIHRQLHDIASRLMDLRQRGQVEAGIAGLADIQPITDEITQLLTSMQTRLQSQAD
jgi:hypothetical protein